MTTTMSNLPEVLVDEIISRVPIISLGSFRSTCKKWKALSKTHILGTSSATARTQLLLGFTLVDYTICSVKLDLHRIINKDDDFVDTSKSSVNQVKKFDEIEIAQLLHCDGLLLCVFKDNLKNSRLMVCKLYLGETRLIKPRHVFNRFDRSGVYAFGYDDDGNHKILRSKSVGDGYEIYSFRTDRWKVLEGTLDGGDTELGQKRSVSLKGNTYFFATKLFPERLEVEEEGVEPMESEESRDYILCFDFTIERFGEPLKLPFNSEGDGEDNVALSCVRDEQLAVLYRSYKSIDIWISTKIQPNVVLLWSKFVEMDLVMLDGFTDGFRVGSFFVNVEKEVAVVLNQIPMFSLPKNKAPGPDGFTADFFISAWSTVGPTVIEAVTEFFTTGKLLKQINATIIALIPKTTSSERL
ncbi:PREDICTED: F-box protein At1g11810-like [Camelina sativa]|uniref:F-box protein At1g11810-like n=1 Tax=Camelina sativa TaxID=90675 RepID=A0ABM1RRS4_CAMSA|nr:PREDICTED: F-box protein At1g11810-like [Camelina sativa]